MPDRPAADSRWRELPTPADAAAVAELVRATGAFSEAEAAVAMELVEERLRRGPASGYEFLLADRAGGGLAGYTCYGPIAGTRSSWDLYWIAVAPDLQGRGLGARLLAKTEARVAAAGGRRLYADTSGRPDYAPTRRFYERSGYAREATLADFYAPGDPKLVYVKALGG